MIVSIKYLGATTSGKFHKYGVVPTTIAAIPASGTGATAIAAVPASTNDHVSELEADGVQMNSNLGTTGFLSRTHLHSVPKVGDVVSVDVRGFTRGTDTTNYFHNIDKTKQEAFASAAKLNREFAEAKAYSSKLEEFDMSFADMQSYENIKILKAKQALIKKQIAAMGDLED